MNGTTRTDGICMLRFLLDGDGLFSAFELGPALAFVLGLEFTLEVLELLLFVSLWVWVSQELQWSVGGVHTFAYSNLATQLSLLEILKSQYFKHQVLIRSESPEYEFRERLPLGWTNCPWPATGTSPPPVAGSDPGLTFDITGFLEATGCKTTGSYDECLYLVRQYVRLCEV